MKFTTGTNYDNNLIPTSTFDISNLTSENIPLDIKENPPIVGKDWPFISVYEIGSEGSLDLELPKLSGVYAYQLISDKTKLYIGMSTDLSKRHSRHVRNVKDNSNFSPVFYAAVNKYGWDNFKLYILETTDLVNTENKEDVLEIYRREQFYFDLCRPCYNLNLVAGPGNQGYVWTPDQALQQSIRQRGVSRPRPDKEGVSFQHSQETKDKMRLRAGGVFVELYDNETLVYSFDSLKAAGKHFNVHYSTIQRYADNKLLWDNKYLIKLIPKVTRDPAVEIPAKEIKLLPLDPTLIRSTSAHGKIVDIFDKDHNLIFKFNSVNDACEYLKSNRHTLAKYAESGELWLNKWYVKYH